MDTSTISTFKNLIKNQRMIGAVAVVEAENESDHCPVEALGVIVVAGVEIKVIVGQGVEVAQELAIQIVEVVQRVRVIKKPTKVV